MRRITILTRWRLANPQDPEAKIRAQGREIFEKTCAACHQPNGLGKEGTAPPLVGSEWVLAPSGDRIARIVLYGLTGPINVKGQQWSLTMVPWRDNYNDEQLAAVLTFVRSKLGDNNASPSHLPLGQPPEPTNIRARKLPDELLKIPLQ